MSILDGSVSEWPGAGAVVVPPVTSEDCVRLPDLEELMRAEYALNRGATIRGGRCMTRATPAELAVTCALVVPVITDAQPEPIEQTMPFTTTGIRFLEVEGTLYIGNGATWETAGTKVVQPIISWNGTTIVATATYNGLSVNGWLYVLTDEGEYNEAGYAVDLGGIP